MEFSREILDKYEILEKVGEGAMGHVYKARHRTLDRFDVIKMIHSRIFISEEAKKKFIREAKITADLRGHKNLVTVYDAGGEDDTPYIAFEYVDGVPLDKKIKSLKVVPARQAVFYAKEICEGLHHAHQMGFIHRDIKSENIILSSQIVDGYEIPKIADFGIAKARDAERPKERKNQDWVLFGTPSYMSPEQASGDEATEASDQYSLGIVLYELLTGSLPFKGIPLQVIMKHINEKPVPVHEVQAEVPYQVSEIVSKILEKNPADRFASMEDLANKLDRTLKFVDKWQKETAQGSRSSRVRSGATASISSFHGPRSTQLTGISSSAFSQQNQAVGTSTKSGISAVVSQSLESLPPPLSVLAPILIRFRLQIGIALATLGVLGVFLLVLSTRGYDPEDLTPRDLKVLSGVSEVVLTWKTAVPYESSITFGLDAESMKSYRGSDVAERDHTVKVPGVEPGRRYSYRVVYPGGQESLMYQFSVPEPEFHFSKSSGFDDEVRVYGTSSLPAVATLHYESGGVTKKIQGSQGGSFETHHAFTISDLFPTRGDRISRIELRFATGEQTTIEGADIAD